MADSVPMGEGAAAGPMASKVRAARDQPLLLVILQNPLVICVLLTLFEMITLLPAAKPFFLALAGLTCLGVLLRPALGTWVMVILLVLQSPAPGFQGTELMFKSFDFELGVNWYTLKLGGPALVHWLVLFLALANFRAVVTELRRLKLATGLEKKFVMGLSFMILVGLVMGLLFHYDWYRYTVEFQAVVYLMVIYFILAIEPEYKKFARRWIFYTMPIGGALYIMFTVFAADSIPMFATRFDVIDYYVLVGLMGSVLLSSSLTGLNLVEVWVTRLVLGAFLLVTLRQWGAISYAAMAILFIYFLLFRRRSGFALFKSMAIGLTGLVFVASISYYWVVVKQDPWATMKTNQIADLLSGGSDTEEMQQSTRVRVIEFQNITYEGMVNPAKGLLGTGFGGYFTDSEYEFNELNPTDFSEDQISGHQYYAPHNNPNWILLKFGWMGAGFMGWFVLMLWKNSLSPSVHHVNQAILFLAGLNVIFMFGYGLKNSFLIALMLVLTLRNEGLKA